MTLLALSKAILTSIRMHELADDSTTIDYTISRDTGKVVFKVSSIPNIVEDDCWIEMRQYNRQRKRSRVYKVPRPAIIESKSNVAPQHTAEVLKPVQQRVRWLGVTTVADLEKLDTRFLDFLVLSGQGKYLRHGRPDPKPLVSQK